MKLYESKDIRNVALLGHGGSGKTILAEAMAYKTKLVDRMGKIEDKSTISDFDAEEQARGMSISLSLIPVEYKNKKINLLDTPGYFDFVGEQHSALRVADAAIIVTDASGGVEVGAEKAWEMISKKGIPAMIVINKFDRENVNFNDTLEAIQGYFGEKAQPFVIPVNEGIGFNQVCDVIEKKAYAYEKGTAKEVAADAVADQIEEIMENMMETIASANEDLMMKYLEGEELTTDEINAGIKDAILAAELVPIFCISANNNVGVDKVMDAIVNLLPSPLDGDTECDPAENTTAFIFKTISDPYVGKISLFKVMNGTAVSTMELTNIDKDKKEKINHIYTMAGKKQIEVEKLATGDIGAFSKLSDSVTNNVLVDGGKELEVAKIEFPKSNMFMAISPKSKGDEDKLGSGLGKIKEEDPTVYLERNVETSQNLIYGVGEMQIEIAASKLKSRFGVEVELDTPIIPYRETIKGKSDAEGKHKKQSGGSGQFGVVNMRFEPTGDPSVEFEFVDEVVGGTVPRQFIPAVEKGMRRSIQNGVLAGYPLVGLKATLYDGKYHPVDSDEMSFITAASLAYKEGIPKAKPVLLEPVYKLTITVPDRYMGDIMGDMSKKRGRIMGMEPVGNRQVISAEAPLSELFKYATELRSMTQARGSFEMSFERYEEVPAAFSEDVIAKAKAKKEEKK